METRTVIDNGEQAEYSLKDIRRWARKGWVYYCPECKNYHCAYGENDRAIDLDFLDKNRKI